MSLQTKPKIKICGITNLEDAIYCANLGTNYLGLIFVPNTKRHLEMQKLPELATQIRKNCPNTKLVLVTKLKFLAKLETVLKLFDIVQIHDKYDKEAIQKLKNLDLKIWQLSQGNIQDANISGFLFDKPKNTQMTIDEYLKILKSTIFPTNFILAGQIGTDNLDKFLEFGPPIIDICSSVESHFGTKSRFKLTQFFQEISQMTN